MIERILATKGEGLYELTLKAGGDQHFHFGKAAHFKQVTESLEPHDFPTTKVPASFLCLVTTESSEAVGEPMKSNCPSAA